eukprot:362169-Chlamydomonas_euryale.AAC.5
MLAVRIRNAGCLEPETKLGEQLPHCSPAYHNRQFHTCVAGHTFPRHTCVAVPRLPGRLGPNPLVAHEVRDPERILAEQVAQLADRQALARAPNVHTRVHTCAEHPRLGRHHRDERRDRCVGRAAGAGVHQGIVRGAEHLGINNTRRTRDAGGGLPHPNVRS